MLKALLIAGGLFAALPAIAHAEPVTLRFEHIQPVQGALMVGIYNSQASYDGGVASGGTKIDVTADHAEVTLDLPAGDYAVKVFHDVNGNGKLDTNPFGIPTEPFAFSNNAHGHMGPATWADAHFTVTAGGLTQTIQF